MKNRRLIIIVLTFIAINGTYGQGLKKFKDIFGINITQKINETQYQITNTSFCDTISSFKTRSMPTGLAWDEQYFWYVDTSYIYKVSSVGMHIDSVINPAFNGFFLKGGGLVYDGLNLWYADEQTANLFKINPANGDVLQQFNLPSFGSGDPNGFGLAWDGVNLWHSQYLPPRLYKLNPANGMIIDSLTTTFGIAGIVWINGKLYGVSGQQLFKISTFDGTIEDSVDWCVPFSLGLTWDGFSLWNVSGPDSLFQNPTGGMETIYEINTDIILSVSKHSKTNIGVEVFPNPTTESISIRGEHLKKIEIYNMRGELIYSITRIKQNSTEINFSNIPKGIYFAKIYDDTNFCTKKIIIQ